MFCCSVELIFNVCEFVWKLCCVLIKLISLFVKLMFDCLRVDELIEFNVFEFGLLVIGLLEVKFFFYVVLFICCKFCELEKCIIVIWFKNEVLLLL